MCGVRICLPPFRGMLFFLRMCKSKGADPKKLSTRSLRRWSAVEDTRLLNVSVLVGSAMVLVLHYNAVPTITHEVIAPHPGRGHGRPRGQIFRSHRSSRA